MNSTEQLPETANGSLAASLATDDFIKSRIFTIRGVQVMLDRDLAVLYGVTAKRLNEQVKRNVNRFPDNFMFRLSDVETRGVVAAIESSAIGSRSQIATLNKGRGSNIKYLPFAFTEHGIIMLASVLKSEIAVEASIRITNTFVAMRRAIASISPLLARIAETERRQLEDRTRQIADQSRNEERFDTIFKAMDGGDFPPQKVFFDGKHYDAFSFARKLVRKAAKSIVLVDNYCDDVTLDILSQKRGGVAVTVATLQKCVTKFLTPAAISKFNKQNQTITVKPVSAFHDRFLILDGVELYHLGASLKDLGRKYCAVTKMDAMFVSSIMQRIQQD
ncbi:MAG: ORF6N domain-containing protein [Kiritimatiellae bacterium]|nr:ORF6N domain-containing protein [Kiritimatiellia bacterium]